MLAFNTQGAIFGFDVELFGCYYYFIFFRVNFSWGKSDHQLKVDLFFWYEVR